MQSQVRLPGSVGRLLKQIRDIEQVAPLFVEAGLVRSVSRPNPLDARVSGVATQATTARTIGGFLYASAAVRVDLQVQHNVVATAGQDSSCEIDDINYENLSKRLALMAMRQAYDLADRVVRQGRSDLVFLDVPLVMDRSMVPPSDSDGEEGYRAAYEATRAAIESFWTTHRPRLFPWNADGPVIVGLASERFGAIVHSARQDLRSTAGRSQLLPTDGIDLARCAALDALGEAIQGVGERRFVHGIVGSYTRTAAFRVSLHAPRMEPQSVAGLGVLGLHFRSAPTTTPRLMQLVGDAPEWDRAALDRVVGMAMALTAVGGAMAAPLPIQLAERELEALGPFLESYGRGVAESLRKRQIEKLWLEDLDVTL